MKVELFSAVPYSGNGEETLTAPAPPRLHDAKRSVDAIEKAFVECELAHQVGFDAINFAEHHSLPALAMDPDPALFAATFGQRVPDAKIGVLGPILSLHNPVRIAEQYAMLDNLLGGRLTTFGPLRGLFNEYLTYGTSPWDSKEAFQEAVLLIKKAWTEPEPFGWEGRFYRYRQVAVWPRPLQSPHPPILLSGNSESSAFFAGKTGCTVGFSFLPLEMVQKHLAAYRQGAAEAGWEPTPEHVHYRANTYVAPTDDEALADIEAFNWPGLDPVWHSVGPELWATMRRIGAWMNGVPRDVRPDLSQTYHNFAPPMVGSPRTVLEKIRTFCGDAGIGRIEVFISRSNDCLSHEQVCRAIELLGEHVVPALHADGSEGKVGS
jgi:alkanesulfonate monooxygenase SsuD/methylene tetrahydromethanopterin reductase-like flavin-dependent oxidoreductase (luciferase family)